MVGRQRSPRYPIVDLERAIGLVRDLYAKVRRGEFLPDDAASAWGYAKVSGATKSRIATLRQYGLIEGKTGAKGAESPTISLRGVTLARRNPTVPDREYMSAIHQAALSPPIFRDIHEMPDATDERLQNRLVVEKEFTEDGAKRCIEAYRATVQFANLDNDGTLSSLDSDNSEETVETKKTVPSTEIAPIGQHPGMMKIMLSAEDEDFAWVKRKMTQAEWDLRIALFQAYEPAIVRDENKVLESASSEATTGSGGSLEPVATTPPADSTPPDRPRS